MWRVKNEIQIRIWRDKWLLQFILQFAPTPRGGLNDNARVVNLIDWDTKGYKINLIRELFGEENANVICQLPLGSIHNSDWLISSPTANENFTASSAYHLQKEKLATYECECFCTGILCLGLVAILKLVRDALQRINIWSGLVLARYVKALDFAITIAASSHEFTHYSTKVNMVSTRHT